jgi:Na+/proline symporter
MNIKYLKKFFVNLNDYLKALNLSVVMIDVMKHFFLIIIIMHIVSSFWIYVGINDLDSSWIQYDQTGNLGKTDYQLDDSTVYVSSLYWVQVTMSSCGFGDIYP